MSIPHSLNDFNALQFHIHAYSEHEIVGKGTVDDNFFPFELHVVHQETTEDSFAVFGTMISVGDLDHAMFEWFLQGWEATAQKVEDECKAAKDHVGRFLSKSTTMVQQKVQCPKIGESIIYDKATPIFPPGEAPNVYEFPTNPEFGVFTYKGGLTTPGCNEIVNWNLLDAPMEISQAQAERLEFLILCYVETTDDEAGNLKSCDHGTVADEVGSTSRPPQDLMGRTVLHRCRDGPTGPKNDIGVLPPVLNQCGAELITGVTATASSVESNHFVADWAVDGNAKSRWASDGPGADAVPFLQLDLGEVRFIDSINLEWEKAYSRKHKIMVSVDGNNWGTVREITAGKGGNEHFSMIYVTAQYVKIESYVGDPDFGISLFAVRIVGDDDGGCIQRPTSCPGNVIDLSSASASASTEEGSRFSPDKAIDGNMWSRWSSKFNDDEWFVVDFGVMTRIDSVWLNWQEAYTESYELQISDSLDGPWTTIDFIKGSDGLRVGDIDSDGNVDALVLGLSAPVTQYVRLQLNERATGWGNSLWEFQVRGTQDPRCVQTEAFLTAHPGYIACPFGISYP
jgi:hypothetical protein